MDGNLPFMEDGYTSMIQTRLVITGLSVERLKNRVMKIHCLYNGLKKLYVPWFLIGEADRANHTLLQPPFLQDVPILISSLSSSIIKERE